ncbi:MAG: PSP1 domain-containing protein [Fastidiosipilaceae bacterium]|jgi:cell fate regulator YaaT (PSP1 superfamily)
MYKVTGVRFHGVGKAYDFETADLPVRKGDAVIVETVQGLELGFAADEGKTLAEDQIRGTLKPLIRIATDADLERYKQNLLLEKEAFKICAEKILEHELEMNLVSVEYTFDGKKIVFYFTADGRVDFRELVKDLARIFRMRIELRQIGVRDEARMIGGVGICGREFCCSSFLTDFIPVSIRMAKEQGLSMNPAKISGCCGRLMCCLKYEQDAYKKARKGMPKMGASIDTPAGRAKVIGMDVLREKLTVLPEDSRGSEPLVFTKAELGLGPAEPETCAECLERAGDFGVLDYEDNTRVDVEERVAEGEREQTDLESVTDRQPDFARQQPREDVRRETRGGQRKPRKLGKPAKPGFVPHPVKRGKKERSNVRQDRDARGGDSRRQSGARSGSSSRGNRPNKAANKSGLKSQRRRETREDYVD